MTQTCSNRPKILRKFLIISLRFWTCLCFHIGRETGYDTTQEELWETLWLATRARCGLISWTIGINGSHFGVENHTKESKEVFIWNNFQPGNRSLHRWQQPRLGLFPAKQINKQFKYLDWVYFILDGLKTIPFSKVVQFPVRSLQSSKQKESTEAAKKK